MFSQNGHKRVFNLKRDTKECLNSNGHKKCLISKGTQNSALSKGTQTIV